MFATLPARRTLGRDSRPSFVVRIWFAYIRRQRSKQGPVAGEDPHRRPLIAAMPRAGATQRALARVWARLRPKRTVSHLTRNAREQSDSEPQGPWRSATRKRESLCICILLGTHAYSNAPLRDSQGLGFCPGVKYTGCSQAPANSERRLGRVSRPCSRPKKRAGEMYFPNGAWTIPSP